MGVDAGSISNVGSCVCDKYVQPVVLRYTNGSAYISLSLIQSLPQHPNTYQSNQINNLGLIV